MKISKAKRLHLMRLCARIAVDNGTICDADMRAALAAFYASMRATMPPWWMR